MEILSKKKLTKIIEDAVSEAEKEAYEKGFKKGYSDGLHAGLTSDKEGVHMNGNGIYAFKEGISKIAIDKK